MNNTFGNQPAPVTMDYGQKYRISDLFIDHLKESLRDMPHYKAVKYVTYVENNKRCIGIADLNSFINKLGMLGYGYVATLMRNINDPEAQLRYFVPIKNSNE